MKNERLQAECWAVQAEYYKAISRTNDSYTAREQQFKFAYEHNLLRAYQYLVNSGMIE